MEAGMSDLDITFRDVVARDDRDWVNFGRSYVTSESFKALFGDGMALVEETAAYLDGEGRDEARLISREATLAYAGESMKLTTRLMQIASWLLVQRAVAEGEISLGQALEEKRRVKLTAPERGVPVPATDEALPERLLDLIERSHRLHTRILHLDALVCDGRPSAEPQASPVAAQVGLLASAFSRG